MEALRARTTWFALTLLLAGVTAGVVSPVRDAALRQAGAVLVCDEPVTRADAVVVTVDSDAAGVLAAADIVRSGMATRVAIFSETPDEAGTEFLRRGLPYEDQAARSTRLLQSLGVMHIEQIALVSGTQQEAEVLPGWCERLGYGIVIVVSEPDHSCRLRRALDRALEGHQTTVIVKPTRYSRYDPDKWWHTRDGVRVQIVETQKLLLDYVLHPF